MASKKEIEKHLKIALAEVGEINPWFDKDVDAWVFSHYSYPVEYAGDSKSDVMKGYPRYLREFIKQRLNQNLAPNVEKKTKGRGGKRAGSGRPKGTKKEPKKRVSLPQDVAKWFDRPGSDIPVSRNCGKRVWLRKVMWHIEAVAKLASTKKSMILTPIFSASMLALCRADEAIPDR